MPFGSDPFRDIFKQSWIHLQNSKCHQCLSAVIPFGTPPLLTCSTTGAQMLSRSGDEKAVHNVRKIYSPSTSPSVNARVGRSGVFAVFISRPEIERVLRLPAPSELVSTGNHWPHLPLLRGLKSSGAWCLCKSCGVSQRFRSEYANP